MRSLRQLTSASTSAATPGRRAGVAALVLMVCVASGAPRRVWAAAENPPPPIHAAAAAAPRGVAAQGAAMPQAAAASASAAAGERAASGAMASGAAQPSPLAQPQPAASPKPDERAGVVNFLGETIGWYRQLSVEERFGTEPAEMLFVNDDRQIALEVTKLAFQYARATAALLKSETPPGAPPSPKGSATGTTAKSETPALPGLAGLVAKAQQQEQRLAQLKQQAKQLKAASAAAKAAQRIELARQLAIVQSQIKLEQTSVDSYNTLIQFESTTAMGGTQGTGLSSQIDALERSVPQLNAPAKGSAPAAPQHVPLASAATTAKTDESASADNGLLGAVEALIGLGKERSAVADRLDNTRHLVALSTAARTPLLERLRELNVRADALAAEPGGGDLAATLARKQQFDDLIKRHKMITEALVPLAKQSVLLQVYVANLQQWNGTVDQRSDSQLRRLILRLAALSVVLLAIFIGAFVWRSLTFRYVQDLRRRRQLLQLRRLTVALVVVLVVLFDFASQLGTLATVMGLAAAGVALALQNVILSFAGYFFVTGRYGIRVGDRIQISGINGDVIDIGLFKLALMELVGDGNSRQPTGRVVVFPNSIVFQTNGNFFKQAPGTSFVWNEFRLTLSPECDYRLAEKRLLEVVEDVYARYRDTVLRQYSDLERDLSMKFESPRPQSRLRLGSNGIELTIRYPADTRHAVQVADEISRRALDAIAQDPALSLAMPGTPNLLPLASPPVAEVAQSSPAAADGHEAPRESETGAADAMVPASAEAVVEPPAKDPPVPQPRPPAKS